MKVTPADMRTIDAWFLRTIGRTAPVCSVCGRGTWLFFPVLVHAPVYARHRTPPPGADTRLAHLGSGLPLILIECRHCGQVLTFNAASILRDEVMAFMEGERADGHTAPPGS